MWVYNFSISVWMRGRSIKNLKIAGSWIRLCHSNVHLYKSLPNYFIDLDLSLKLIAPFPSGNSRMSFAICHIIWAPCLKGGGSVSNREKSRLAFLLGTFFETISQAAHFLDTVGQEATKHPYLVVSGCHRNWPEKKPWPPKSSSVSNQKWME